MTTRQTIAHRLGPARDIPVGEGRTYTVDGEQVAVFRLRDGRVRATQAVCPHSGGPLADGQVDLVKVVCPLHGRSFAFADGTCRESEHITVYEAATEDGELVVWR
jgi:nitrite reductase (NADH) small subunit